MDSYILISQIRSETLEESNPYSNTPSLYTPMVKCSYIYILSDKSLGGLVWRYLAPFGRHFDFFVTSTIPSAFKRRRYTG